MRGHGRGRMMGDVDTHGFLPKLSCGACLRLLCIIVAAADAVGHGFAWVVISRGLAPETLYLAEREAEHYTFRCDTIDVAAGGVVRGLCVLIVMCYLSCCAEEKIVPAAGGRARWTIGDDYKRTGRLQKAPGGKIFAPRMSHARLVMTLFLLALAALSVGKAFVVTAKGCTTDRFTPWLHHGQREELVWSSGTVGLLELLLFLAQNIMARRELMTAAREAELRGETMPLLAPGMVRPGENSGASLTRLLALAKSEVCLISVGIGMLLLSTMANLVLPQVAGAIVDAISEKKGDHHMNVVIRNFLFVVVAGAVTTSIRNYLFTLVGQRLVYKLRSQLYKAIISQETSFFDESKTGELLNRLSNDTQVMQSSITQNISMCVSPVTVQSAQMISLAATSLHGRMGSHLSLPHCSSALRSVPPPPPPPVSVQVLAVDLLGSDGHLHYAVYLADPRCCCAGDRSGPHLHRRRLRTYDLQRCSPCRQQVDMTYK